MESRSLVALEQRYWITDSSKFAYNHHHIPREHGSLDIFDENFAISNVSMDPSPAVDSIFGKHQRDANIESNVFSTDSVMDQRIACDLKNIENGTDFNDCFETRALVSRQRESSTISCCEIQHSSMYAHLKTDERDSMLNLNATSNVRM